MKPRSALTHVVSMIILSSIAAAHAAEEPRTVQKDPGNDSAKSDQAALVRGNTTFGLGLYSRLRQGPGNVFLSPFSLSTALAMTADGARGRRPGRWPRPSTSPSARIGPTPPSNR